MMNLKVVSEYRCTYDCTDADGDGHYAKTAACPIGDDSNDGDATEHPGAPELCDNKDNNGNGLVDEGCWCNSCLNVSNGTK